jgi:hypothetical protein
MTPEVKSRELQLTAKTISVHFLSNVRLGNGLVEDYVVFDDSVPKFNGIRFKVRRRSIIIHHPSWDFDVEVPFHMVKAHYRKVDSRLRSKGPVKGQT